MGAKFSPSFGLTTCGWPQLKCLSLSLFNDLGLRLISGASCRKLQLNLAPVFKHPETNCLRNSKLAFKIVVA